MCINPILRIGLMHKWSIDSKFLITLCKQNLTSLSLLARTTVVYIQIHVVKMWHFFSDRVSDLTLTRFFYLRQRIVCMHTVVIPLRQFGSRHLFRCYGNFFIMFNFFIWSQINAPKCLGSDWSLLIKFTLYLLALKLYKNINVWCLGMK